MPRITLANWYGDLKPGDELDVDEVQLKALRRDGFVTEPEQPTQGEEQAPTPITERPAQPQPAPDPAPSRKKR